MTEPPSSSLRKDFRIFRDPGFLITLILIGVLLAAGAYILVHASNEYGIPIRVYWHGQGSPLIGSHFREHL
jgi:hypothetical protein